MLNLTLLFLFNWNDKADPVALRFNLFCDIVQSFAIYFEKTIHNVNNCVLFYGHKHILLNKANGWQTIAPQLFCHVDGG